ncbi:hypothetical protein B0H17DRAFT_1204782 [Mycena rosella]|uniref:Small ribosomal subunit protein bS18m n=1 Tax=Mycena rosella TaxID=1033263 RepID=A0AAD7D8P5_MYCRO|nr:hypothetical protein B0H17DRAFT_1204782 [Mycena rosella]
MLSTLRATLRPARARACFSTSRVASNEDKGAMAVLAEQLDAQARTQQPNDEDASNASTVRPVHEYRPFHPNSVVRPYDISLKGRTWGQRPMTRRPNVAGATRDARKNDVFYQLNVDPLKLALHPGVLSHFVSEMAMIAPRRQTGLTMKSQRRIAKAIRRAKMIGILPLHSRMYNNGEMW